jgi:hypothetical protein
MDNSKYFISDIFKKSLKEVLVHFNLEPLLFTIADSSGQMFLAQAIEKEEFFNYWVLVGVSKEDVQSLKEERTSPKELFLGGRTVLYVSEDSEYIEGQTLSKEQLLDLSEYFPSYVPLKEKG